VYLHFPSLLPALYHRYPSPSAPSHFLLAFMWSLCITCNEGVVVLRICWFSDYFEPTTPVAQHGGNDCIGGKEGIVDVDGLAIPNL